MVSISRAKNDYCQTLRFVNAIEADTDEDDDADEYTLDLTSALWTLMYIPSR